MSQQSVITDELRKKIGSDLGSATIEIEKGMIRKLAEAVEDNNPLWLDPAHAKKTRNRGLVASPGLFTAAMMRGGPIRPLEAGLKRLLDGGGEYEFFKPVRPGDVLTIQNKVHDLYERTGRMGIMLFQVFETTWTNQKGELVARCLATLISY